MHSALFVCIKAAEVQFLGAFLGAHLNLWCRQCTCISGEAPGDVTVH